MYKYEVPRCLAKPLKTPRGFTKPLRTLRASWSPLYGCPFDAPPVSVRKKNKICIYVCMWRPMDFAKALKAPSLWSTSVSAGQKTKMCISMCTKPLGALWSPFCTGDSYIHLSLFYHCIVALKKSSGNNYTDLSTINSTINYWPIVILCVNNKYTLLSAHICNRFYGHMSDVYPYMCQIWNQ